MNINDINPSDIQVAQPGAQHLNINNIDPSQISTDQTPNAGDSAALAAMGTGGSSGSNGDSTPQQSSDSTLDGLSSLVKTPINDMIVRPGQRIGQALVTAAEPLMSPNERNIVQTNMEQPTTTRLLGANFTNTPMTSMEQAGGEALSDAGQIGALAAGGAEGTGARVLGMGAAGATSGAGQAMQNNEGAGSVALSAGVGGLAGLALSGGTEIASSLMSKGISQTAADMAVNRYAAVFKPTPEEIESGANYQSLLQMRKENPDIYQATVDAHPELFNKDGTLIPPVSLAAKALKDLPAGSTNDLLRQVKTNMSILGDQLNTEATQSGVSFQLSPADVKDYSSLLTDVKQQFSNSNGDPAFSSTAKQAQQLLTTLQRNDGTLGPADVLEMRQFLDDLRKTKEFNTNANLSPKGEQFKGAADQLRQMFNDEVPGAKQTMSKFVDAYNQRDALLARAVKEGKAAPFSLGDLVLGGAGIASGNPLTGVGADVAKRSLSSTSFNTGLGQGLQKVADVTSPIEQKISQVLGSRPLSAVTGPIRVAGRSLVPTLSGAAAGTVIPSQNQ
jgi:hypothetical protein